MSRLATAVLWVLLAGCASTPELAAPAPPGERVAEETPRWVTGPASGWDPAADPYTLFATGRSDLGAAILTAETVARQDARQRLSAGLLSLAGRLVEAALSQGLGGEGETALRDPELAQRATALGQAEARVRGKWFDDQSFWVWMEVDAGAAFFSTWMAGARERLAPLGRPIDDAGERRLRQELERAVADLNGAS